MMITVELSPHTQQRLEVLASRKGKPVEAFVSDLIEKTIQNRSFDDILAPFRESFAASGMSEEEAESLLDAELKAVRKVRLQAKSSNG